jgi:hypothetical protein
MLPRPSVKNRKVNVIEYLLTLLGAGSILFFSYLMLQIIIPYLSGRTDIDFLLTKQRLVHRWDYMTAFYLHIYSSIFVLLAGVTQFSRTLILDYPLWHRRIGQMYVFIILTVSGPGGLFMSFFANGNIFARIGFVVLTTIWLAFTYMGWQTAIQKKFVEHGNWLIRSYALTFSAITLRLYQFGLSYIREFNPLSPMETYSLLAYLSWIPNLIFVEFLIRKGVSRHLLKNNDFLVKKVSKN